MNIQAKKSILSQKKATLYNEVVAIKHEVSILQALQKKAEEELSEVEIKLEELDENSSINLVYNS